MAPVVSRKTVLILLVALVLLSIAFRYPLVEHERFQTDSYTIHLFAKSIMDNGQAKWTFNLLSYIGYYPISYPSGSPFLLAEVSDATGMRLESSILLMNFLLSAVFCLGAFLLARQFVRRSDYALLATFFAVTGARFVDTTYWNASARGPIIVFITLTIFVLFRAAATGQTKFLLLALLVGIGCFVTHHMAVVLTLFGAGYALAAFQVGYLLPRIRTHKRRVVVALNGAVAALVIAISFGFFGYFYNLALMNLRESALFNLNPPALSIVLNLAVSYTNQIGFIIVFAFLGIPIVFRDKDGRLSIETLFPLAVVIAFIPLLGNTLYVSMVLAPFVSILGVICIARILRSAKRKRVVFVVVLFLMASAIFLPFWSSGRWNEGGDYLSGQTVEVDSRIYSDATYLEFEYPDTFGISNVNTFWIQLGVSSDTRFLTSGVPLAINGDIKESDMEANVSWSSASFPTNLYVWFEYKQEPNVDGYVEVLVTYGVGYIRGSFSGTERARYFSDHPKLVVAIDNDHPESYAGTYNQRNSTLPSELKQASWVDSYMVYQSSRLTLFAVDLNS